MPEQPPRRRWQCHIHADVLAFVDELEYFVKVDVDDIDTRREMLAILSGIRRATRQATKAGIRMENRLREYVAGIEDLGFTRKVKKPLGS